eukprot:12685480-Prorocentrum_lima.AAC.1
MVNPGTNGLATLERLEVLPALQEQVQPQVHLSAEALAQHAGDKNGEDEDLPEGNGAPEP